MHTLHNCPVCGASDFDPFLTCKDFTVSKENFNIQCCKSCSFLFTNPIPDIAELGKYYKSEDYVSHTSSKKGLINFLYNQVRKITLKQKIRLISRIAKGKKLLDFGCGTGHFLTQARAAGFEISGIEPDDDARKFAIENNKIPALPRPGFDTLGEQFDLITLWHVLEHLPELNQDIDKLSKLLKPDGTLLIAVPNPDSCDAKWYKENWAGYDVPRHLYHFTPATIQQLMKKHGFELYEMLPMKFDAYYVAMLSEKNLGNGAMKGFINGRRSNKMAKKNPGTWSSQIYLFRKQN